MVLATVPPLESVLFNFLVAILMCLGPPRLILCYAKSSRNWFQPESLWGSRKALTIYCCIVKLPHILSGLNNNHHVLSLKSLRVDWDQLGGCCPHAASFRALTGWEHARWLTHLTCCLCWLLVGSSVGAVSWLLTSLSMWFGWLTTVMIGFQEHKRGSCRSLKAQPWKWHAFMSAALPWLKQVTGSTRLKRRKNRLHRWSLPFFKGSGPL